MSFKLLFVTRLMDCTSTELFLRAVARFTKIRPLWYHSSGLWGSVIRIRGQSLH